MRRSQRREISFETDSQAAKDLILRRQKAEERILNQIERLIEPGVGDKILLRSAEILRPADYVEAVLERNCVQLCGYPICDKSVGGLGSARRFDHKRLVMRDTSNDHRFCTLGHRKASKFFEMQLPETPLWYRDLDNHGTTLQEVELLNESDIEGSLRAWLDRKDAKPKESSRKAQIDAGPMMIVEKMPQIDKVDDFENMETYGDHRSIEGFTTNQDRSKKSAPM